MESGVELTPETAERGGAVGGVLAAAGGVLSVTEQVRDAGGFSLGEQGWRPSPSRSQSW